MKIIGTDNFDREIVNNYLVAENIQNKEMADVMVKALNDKYCNYDDAPTFYKVVEDNHKLFKFEP